MRAYIKLLILLIVSFVIMSALSELDDLRVFGHDIATMKRITLDAGETALPLSDTAEIVMAPSIAIAVEDTLPRTILMIGDSMIEGLSRRMGAYAYHNGHKLYAVIWYGSTTEKWSESGRLAQYADSLKPDYIMICLGGNELFIRGIKEKRRGCVKEIVSEAGTIPYVWIGPPNWKDDTGINELIRSEVGDDRFFLSKYMQFERASDGCHPTRESSYQWMDSVVRWMVKTVPHPRLDTPPMKVKNPYETIVLTPDD